MFSVDVQLDADARTRCRACATRRRRFALGGIGAHGADLSCANSYATSAAPRPVSRSPDMVVPTTGRPTRAERRRLGCCKRVSKAICERAARRVCWNLKINGSYGASRKETYRCDYCGPRSLRVRMQTAVYCLGLPHEEKRATTGRGSRKIRRPTLARVHALPEAESAPRDMPQDAKRLTLRGPLLRGLQHDVRGAVASVEQSRRGCTDNWPPCSPGTPETGAL